MPIHAEGRYGHVGAVRRRLIASNALGTRNGYVRMAFPAHLGQCDGLDDDASASNQIEHKKAHHCDQQTSF
jgi:hypothetical protein